MYMNLKPNKHKRMSFNTSTMTSLGFIGAPLNLGPPKFNFLLRSPPRLFLSQIFMYSPKIRGGWYHDVRMKSLFEEAQAENTVS